MVTMVPHDSLCISLELYCHCESRFGLLNILLNFHQAHILWVSLGLGLLRSDEPVTCELQQVTSLFSVGMDSSLNIPAVDNINASLGGHQLNNLFQRR